VSTEIAPFTLSAGGEDDDDSRLRARLSARKPVTLKHVPVSRDDELLKRDAFARAVAGSAADLVGNGVTTVGVVVNRVATAQNVAALLRERSPKSRVFLITGRMRPLDRDALLENLRPHIEASRERDVSVAPLLVVATQCIEAGADFDFDALVTECASLDALKQRFGRLNRLGIRAQSPGVILARSDQTSASAKPDPVYGGALKATWEWLQARSRALDFGIRHLPDPTSQELETLIAPRQHAPVLLPTHVDAWSQTQLHPHPDPDVALWLHGPQRGEPEVQLVWRADCTAELMRTTEGAEVLKARLAACPPSVGEALSVPISAAQRWLAHMPIGDVADVPASAPEDEPRARAQMRPALWWRGEESRVLDQHYRLEPGMTLVVPTDYGGLAHGNWAPDGVQGLSEPIQDLGDLAQWLQRGRATLRLRLESLPTALRTVTEAFGLPRRSRDDEDQDLNGQVAAWVDAALRTELSAHWQTILAALASKPRIVEDEDGSLTLIARRSRMQSDPTSTEDDGASFTERATSLDEHSQHVWCWADGICHRLGLPEDIRRDIVLAAWLHDAGKADPRFQRWLAGGTEVRLAMLDQPLAKSAQTQRDRQAMNIARQRAGYPAGYRHELLSVAMVQSHPSLLDQASDRDLVLHLIGAHHGWCRPFAPFLDDEENLAVKVDLGLGPSSQRVELTAGTRHGLGRLDSGVADRFWTLTERYGWWGLAWLEAILRLSDHRASAHGAPDA
jgi:CRISPR-associated endonuclease/helicase Cas3